MNSAKAKQTAIVTGASKGIGRAICVEFARTGYDVLINYRSDHAGARETLSLVEAQGAAGRLICFDVTDADVSQRILESLSQEYDTLDVLVNNAGITADALFVMMSRNSWDKVIRTSLDGFYNTTKPVLEKMVRQKSGSIVTIASVSGLMANRGQANYSAAKAGLIGASRTVAAEVGRLGVRVNVVAPGMIETAMMENAPKHNIKQLIPMARIGRPEEVAKVVRFLCSEDASYITGQVISVNGGMF
ncbi:MAG: 3-oxoacyl-ACP reductase FabG [Pseudomonadota bacterium]